VRQLSPTAVKALEKSVKRHALAVARAEQVAPGVTEFFKKDVAAILEGK